jgi:protein disulfide-isomerase A6
LRDWALGLLPAEGVARLGSRAELDGLLQRCSPAAKGKGKASWALCAVLVSDKAGPGAPPPALLRSLAARYAGKVAFGLAGGSSAAAQALLGGGGGKSRLVLVCNGDLALQQLSAGALRGEVLAKELEGYAGGGRCASQVRLSPGMDFSQLSGAALRRVMQERGLGCRGCAERADFVERLRQHLLEQEAGGGGGRQEL